MRASFLRTPGIFGTAVVLAVYLTLPTQAAPPLEKEEAAREKMRPICQAPKARADVVAQLEKRAPEYRRSAVKWDLDMVCAQVELSLTPIHDTVNRSPEASHTSWIYDARWSADGRTILSASRDGTMRLWDVNTGKTLHIVRPPRQGIVRSAIFLADSNKIAVAADAQPLSLHDVTSGQIVKVPFKTIEPNDSHPPYMAATSTGLLLVAGKADDVIAFDGFAMTERYRLPGHQPNATAVAVSEIARLVATGAEINGATARVSIWKLDTGKKVADFHPIGDSRPSALAFSRDGTQLAILQGGVVNIYSVTGSLTRRIVVHPFASAFDAAFTVDGKGLISCQSHPILWDLETGSLVRHFGGWSDLCHSIDVSPDGRFAVTGSMGSDVRIWEIATGAFHRRLGFDVQPPR